MTTTSAATDPDASASSDESGLITLHGDSVFTTQRDLKMLGIALGTRMTVLRLPDDSLLLHSPVAPTPALKAHIDSLGDVRHILAPNLLHYMGVSAAQEAWPEAKTWSAPGLGRKKTTLRIDHELETGGGAQTPWGASDAVSWMVYDAAPKLQEVVLCHNESRTLVLTDLSLNMQSASGWWTRTFLKMYGAWQRFGPSKIVRMMTKDRALARERIDQMLTWEFDRVSVTHGDIYEAGDAREQLRAGFSGWLPE